MNKQKNTAAMLVELQKNLDHLSKSVGMPRVDLTTVKSTAQRTPKTVVMKQTAKRDMAFHAATQDESFGTRSARAIGKGDNISKAAAEDAVDIAPGFTSMSRLTGKY